jgi:predicted Zn-dependent protease
MRTTRTRIIGLAAAVAVIIIGGCATTGPGGKKSLILISTAQEVSIGQQMDQELRKSETFLADSAWQVYINDLGQRIVAVSDRKDLPFQFAVIESDEINAFAAPGGYVYFYTGLIRDMDEESELAGVMAHEISHVVARHSIKRLQSVMGVSILMQLALGESSDNTRALASTALGIVMSGYSRSQETEADNFGTLYMAKAGWNPQGMVAMFEKLNALSGQQQTDLFEMLASTHPPTDLRIENTQKQIAGMGSLSPTLQLDNPRFQTMKKRLPPKKDQKK